MLVAGLLAASAGLTVVFAAAPASADAGACISYLEGQGQDTTVRVQACAETETLADTVSQQHALTVCTALMAVTGLPPNHTSKACTLAAAP